MIQNNLSNPDSTSELHEIFTCGMLTEKSIDALSVLNAELNGQREKRQIFRTETEALFSVLNDGSCPTPAAKYWQANRELNTMLDNLAHDGFSYRRNELALKRHYAKLKDAKDEFEREEAQIDIDECLFKRRNIFQVANDRVRELLMWSSIMAELDDGTFDNQDVNTHQAESLYKSLLYREQCLTNGSSQAEIANVIGPLSTLKKVFNHEQILPTR